MIADHKEDRMTTSTHSHVTLFTTCNLQLAVHVSLSNLQNAKLLLHKWSRIMHVIHTITRLEPITDTVVIDLDEIAT